MPKPSRALVATALAALSSVVGVLAAAPPASAARPGDASAAGLILDFGGSLNGFPVISAHGAVGVVNTPQGSGTNELNNVDIAASVGPTVNLTAIGTVEEARATRTPTSSLGTTTVNNFALRMFGTDTFKASTLARAECETDDAFASGGVGNAELFGNPAPVSFAGPPVVDSRPVFLAIPGVTSPVLTVEASAGATIPDPAVESLIALRIKASLRAVVNGQTTTIPLGQADVGIASCNSLLTPPTATLITPSSGPTSGGQQVTIAGINFVPGQTTVRFDGAPATNVVVNAAGTSLTARTPAGGAGPASVVVSTTFGGPAVALTYTYLYDGSHAIVSSVAPASGPTAGNTQVVISGLHLDGATGVTVGGTPAANFVGNVATISFPTPPSATAGPAPIRIVFQGGTVAAGTFTYVAPVVTRLVPNSGTVAGGDVVTIYGTGLRPATAVTFGGAPAQILLPPTDTTIVVLTPQHAPDTVDVAVVLPGLDAVLPQGYNYLGPHLPTVSSLTPAVGDTSGGQQVVITGTGLFSTSAVTFGGVPGTIVGVPTATSLVVRTPPARFGLVTVAIIGKAGVVAIPDGYRYVLAAGTGLPPKPVHSGQG